MSGTLFKRADGAIFSDVAGDVVALDVRNGHCYGMEDVAAAVWGLLAEPAGLDQLCKTLLDLYDVSPGQCREEVAALISQMQREGLVEAIAGENS